MKEIVVKPGAEITLGKRGENKARVVVFDIAGWQMTYGEGRVELIHRRNGDKAPYPCVLEVIGSMVRWELTNADTEKAGRGSCELQYLVNDVVVKSESYHTRVIQALGPAGETPPDPAQGWVDLVLQAGGSNNGPLVAKVEALEDRVAAIEAGGGNTGGGDSGGGDSGGEPDSELSARVAELAQQIEKLDKQINPYVNIEVTPKSIGTYEMGTTVNEVTVTWSVNKTPQILTITGPSTGGTQTLSNNATSYTVPDKQLGINMNNASSFRWTIAATGEEGEVSSKQSPVIGFQNQVYWGAAAMPETINSAFVRGLSGKKLTGSKVTSFSVNAGTGQYIWYCLPVRSPFGTCTFKVGGFEGGFALATAEPIEFQNASGYTEPYYVYRSVESNLGNTTVGVS